MTSIEPLENPDNLGGPLKSRMKSADYLIFATLYVDWLKIN